MSAQRFKRGAVVALQFGESLHNVRRESRSRISGAFLDQHGKR
jgi:hypothetical protein